MSSDDDLTLSRYSHTPGGTTPRELSPDIVVGDYENKLIAYGYRLGYADGKRGGFAVGMRKGLSLGKELAEEEAKSPSESDHKSDTGKN